MLRFAEFMKHFSGSLASSRDRPLQITNNVKVHLAYQTTDVTRSQTHRVVCLCTNFGVFVTLDTCRENYYEDTFPEYLSSRFNDLKQSTTGEVKSNDRFKLRMIWYFSDHEWTCSCVTDNSRAVGFVASIDRTTFDSILWGSNWKM